MLAQPQVIDVPSGELTVRERKTADFRSFWMTGFEAASHIKQSGERVDMIAGTRHDLHSQGDYARLKRLGFEVARDALRWHLIDRGTGSLNFSSFLPQLHAALDSGVQVIWSLKHYGYPEELDIFSAGFIKRFVRFAAETAHLVREHSDDIPYFTPINEISFFSWAASGRGFYPFAEGRDNELKRQIVRASVEACHALRGIDPRCRFVYPEPIINVVAPLNRPDLTEHTKRLNESQFEAWDMLGGFQAPELGGSPDLLDIIGMNFYHSNQWEHEGAPLGWDTVPRDPRWAPLHRLMEKVWRRYQRPLFLAETSHIGIGRAAWILDTAEETALALRLGVPIEGICLFPAIDRYDWNDSDHWHNSGLWDLLPGDMSFSRQLNPEYALALDLAQQLISRARTEGGNSNAR